jgi:ribulose-phosphate 3-epimerase
MTVNPGFAGQRLIPQMIDKIAKTRAFLDSRGCTDMSIQVDGNCSFENIPKMRAAGADCFVAGSSSVFSRDLTVRSAAERLRRIMK